MMPNSDSNKAMDEETSLICAEQIVSFVVQLKLANALCPVPRKTISFEQIHASALLYVSEVLKVEVKANDQ